MMVLAVLLLALTAAVLVPVGLPVLWLVALGHGLAAVRR